MLRDATYLAHPTTAAALHLQRAGQWDMALALVGDDFPDIRAELLLERFFWQNADAGEAIAAAHAVEQPLRDVLLARISYFHKLFQLDNPLDIDELTVYSAVDGPWAAFWSGVILDNVHERPADAQAAYARARAQMGDDRFLESYVVRHEAFHLLETDPAQALAKSRRSLALRASLGARPQTAAAQAAVASMLPEGDPEAAELRELSYATAEELNLAWLKPKPE